MDVISFTSEQTNNEPIALEQPTRRRRGRPPKNPANVTISADGSPAAAPKTRRSSKLKGEDVEVIVSQMFDLYVVFSRRPYWHVDKTEITPWSNQAASILNSIPSRYVKAFADSSAYFAVGFGLFKIVKPRMEMDARVNQELKLAKNRPKPEPKTEEFSSSEEAKPNDNGFQPSNVDALFDEVPR